MLYVTCTYWVQPSIYGNKVLYKILGWRFPVIDLWQIYRVNIDYIDILKLRVMVNSRNGKMETKYSSIGHGNILSQYIDMY